MTLKQRLADPASIIVYAVLCAMCPYVGHTPPATMEMAVAGFPTVFERIDEIRDGDEFTDGFGEAIAKGFQAVNVPELAAATALTSPGSAFADLAAANAWATTAKTQIDNNFAAVYAKLNTVLTALKNANIIAPDAA